MTKCLEPAQPSGRENPFNSGHPDRFVFPTGRTTASSHSLSVVVSHITWFDWGDGPTRPEELSIIWPTIRSSHSFSQSDPHLLFRPRYHQNVLSSRSLAPFVASSVGYSSILREAALRTRSWEEEKVGGSVGGRLRRRENQRTIYFRGARGARFR